MRPLYELVEAAGWPDARCAAVLPDAPVPTGPVVVAKAADIAQWHKDIEGNVDLETRLNRVRRTLAPAADLRRSLAMPPGLAAIEAESRRFPNFAPVFEYLSDFALLSDRDSGFRMPPLLLIGPPGVGKTALMRSLGRLLGHPPVPIAMAAATASFSLGGISMGFGSGGFGLIFASLVMGAPTLPANRLFQVDEIDKVNADLRFDPLGPLYGLLEPASAVNFQDEAVCFPIDASRLNWIATANATDRIPDPILNRFEVIEVRAPRADEMPSVVASVWEEVRATETWGSRFDPALADGVIDRLAGFGTPRTISLALRRAAARAKRQARREIQVDDVGEPTGALLQPERRVGFY